MMLVKPLEVIPPTPAFPFKFFFDPFVAQLALADRNSLPNNTNKAINPQIPT